MEAKKKIISIIIKAITDFGISTTSSDEKEKVVYNSADQIIQTLEDQIPFPEKMDTASVQTVIQNHVSDKLNQGERRLLANIIILCFGRYVSENYVPKSHNPAAEKLYRRVPNNRSSFAMSTNKESDYHYEEVEVGSVSEDKIKEASSRYLELLMLRSEPNEMYSSDTMDQMIEEKRQELVSMISSQTIAFETSSKHEIVKLLETCFEPKNLECDGAGCFGCWKDVVREAIKKLSTLPINEDQKKPFIIANIRELLNNFNKGDISFGRMVEILNETAASFAGIFQPQQARPLLFSEIKLGMRVMDNDGDIGIVKECHDPHNVIVEGETAKAIHCMAEGCDDFGKSHLYLPIDEFESLFHEHIIFATEKFPDSSWYSSLEGLRREIKEVQQEFGLSKEKLMLEYVDCLMYLLDSAARAGMTMEMWKKYFRMKLIINKGRTWIKNEDDSYSHKK